MYRADFVAADGQSWWLCETQIDSRTDEARRELGASLGFTDSEWFADPNRRTVLFDLLESNGSPLLNDLDYLTDDDAKLQWVRGAIRLAAPPPAAPTQDDPIDAAQPAQADTPPAAPPPPPAKKSIFKSKDAAATSGPAQPAQADVPPAAPAKKSIFKPKVAADATDPVQTPDGAGSDAAATDGDSHSDATGPAAAPQLDQAVQTVLAHVTGDGLAGLAQDLGAEADELEAIVNHPDFEREVREEVARITVA